MADLKRLKEDAESFSILYAEDNDALRENASKLLKKFFKNVYTAPDGVEGLEIFKKYHPEIVITDIKMPQMSGMELAKHIRHINPETKIVLMSAFDDKEYLYGAIELGVFRYIKKPVSLTDLSYILHEAIKQINHENQAKLFYVHLQSVFNYQSSMVIMLKGTKPILANQALLDFFEVQTIEEGIEIYGDIGNLFLEHSGFLYNKADEHWFEKVSQNEQKLFHVKLKDTKDNIKHFILKYQITPDEESSGILSFDDITELNLLTLFDAKRAKSDKNLKDTKAMFQLLEVIRRNSAKVELHNYYKGLSIVHDAIIVEVKDDSIVLKTSYMQEKAIQYEQNTLIISDALPNAVLCQNITQISFESQSVECKNIHFIPTSPITRKTIRLVPEEKHTVSLFINKSKFQGDVTIEDISLDAVKLKLNAFPAGLVKDDKVIIDMVLKIDNRPLIINTTAKMFRKSESRYSFSVVFLFEFALGKKGELVKYITQRQMAIIREFKDMQNG